MLSVGAASSQSLELVSAGVVVSDALPQGSSAEVFVSLELVAAHGSSAGVFSVPCVGVSVTSVSAHGSCWFRCFLILLTHLVLLIQRL